MIKPVSYTHLDVYKRQIFSCYDDRRICAFIFLAFKEHSVFFPVIILDSPVHIRYTKALRFISCIRPCHLFPETVQFFLCHTFSIVNDLENDFISLLFTGNQDFTFPPLILNSMIKRILDKRLQCKLRYNVAVDLLIHLDLIVQNILIAELLDLQIALNMLSLIHI